MADDPIAPEPDTKDWTWVLDRPCPECGFDATTTPAAIVGAELRTQVERWQEILGEDPNLVGARPTPTTWSALEYGCHVRDVLRIYDERLTLMLTEDDPDFPNWDQDATAIEARYHEDVPSGVASAIGEEGRRLAEKFDAIEGTQWERTGLRSDGAAFTIDTFSRYFLHDIVHHSHDAQQGFASLQRR